MTKRILVIGGTGTLGRVVVRKLVEAGQSVRVLSRGRRREEPGAEHVRGDVSTGAGLDAAVADVDTIMLCVEPVAPVLEAAKRAGNSPHIVYISIVGIDRVPLSYYGAKLADERLIEASGLPWSVLRATQFHDLIAVILRGAARLPVMFLPGGWSFQPVDVRDVADRMVTIALGKPTGRAPDLAGPRVQTIRDLAHTYLRTVGKRRPIVPLWLPGKVFRAYRRGGHLAPEHATGRITFAEYAAEHRAAGTWPTYPVTLSDFKSRTKR